VARHRPSPRLQGVHCGTLVPSRPRVGGVRMRGQPNPLPLPRPLPLSS
jgi:hypothetical protein